METVEEKKVVACLLTTSEMRKRKHEVLNSLKQKVLGKQELLNGYKFEFPGTDQMLDELVAFIKSERACCEFFNFDLSISDNKSSIWLSATGPEGTKSFLRTEMDL